jgi:hypothetical protein
VSEGLRASEVTVEVRDAEGRNQFLPVERDFLSYEGERPYLPVSVLAVDANQRVAIISLPVEADSGANRIWVKTEHLLDLTEAATCCGMVCGP